MKKKMIRRALIGFPIGITIGQFILLLSNLAFAPEGRFSPCVPALMEAVGSELGAVALQTFLCGIYGAACAAGSVVWDTDWSLAAQTGVYFAIVAGTGLPIAYLLHWMNHSLVWLLQYAAMFIGLFLAIWLAQYFAWRAKVKQLNERTKQE